jgi:cell division protein ZapA (FtsZ GTPase activity inhibitor)
MISDQKTLTVSILGKSYSLITDEKKEVVEAAARLVESYLSKISGAAVGTSTSPAEMVKVTTFVALKFAVDLLKERDMLKAVNDRTAKLNDLIEDSLA